MNNPFWQQGPKFLEEDNENIFKEYQSVNVFNHGLWFVLHLLRSRRYPERSIEDFDFVDDITLLASDMLRAQEFLLTVEEQAKAIGLGLNAKKTEVMAWNIHGNGNEDENTIIITVNGHEVK